MNKKHEILFEPVKIGKVEIKNRFTMAPMGNGGLVTSEGAYSERGIEYYVRRAQGGVGMIESGLTVVEDSLEGVGRGLVPCTAFNPPIFMQATRQMTERIHAYDTKFFMQLTAGGGRINNPAWVMKGKRMISASENSNRWDSKIKCRELTTEEVKMLIKDIAVSAKLAQLGDCDGVAIHAVHEGYLMDQFCTAIFNKRKDEFGGSLEARMQFPIQVREMIRKLCGSDFPVILRFSTKHMMKDLGQGAVPGERFEELGRDMDESLLAAKILEEAGYDAFDADVGCYDSHYWSHPPMYLGSGIYLPYNEQLKKVLHVPVITAGRMDDPDLASDAIRKGQTDMIGLGRPLLADPDLVNKIKSFNIEDIRPCLSCHDGCFEHMGTLLSCALRPQTGREKDYAIEPASKLKKVLIVGGGVGGCEAARVAAIRGHNVTLIEKAEEIGGNLLTAGAPDFKENEIKLANWYKKQLKDLGVTVKLGTEASEKIIEVNSPDTVIIATGSSHNTFNIPGDKNSLLRATASEILNGEKESGERPLIIGGGLVGAELALMLLKEGKKVTLVESLNKILSAGEHINFCNKDCLIDLLNYYKATIYNSSKVVRTEDDKVIIETNIDGNILVTKVVADSLIYAVGFSSRRELYEKIKFKEEYEVHLLGDARKVSNIMSAIWNAYEISKNI